MLKMKIEKNKSKININLMISKKTNWLCQRRGKGKWRIRNNMHHAFMLSCISRFLHPDLNIVLF